VHSGWGEIGKPPWEIEAFTVSIEQATQTDEKNQSGWMA
jgi:hypothetical protein